MIRERKAPPRLLPVVNRLTAAAHGSGRPYHSARAWPGLSLAGLVVGILVLVLPSGWGSPPSPDVPSMVECTVMRPPQILAFGSGASSILSPPRARQAAVMGPQVSAPHDHLVRDAGDLDDDDPPSMDDDNLPVTAALPRGALGLPLTPAHMGGTDAAYAFPWPFPYLARPQLLTRS
jgi:hypothetical protein